MLKGGVIMDVVTPEQAKIAEDAGACSVMALERVPSDIRNNPMYKHDKFLKFKPKQVKSPKKLIGMLEGVTKIHNSLMTSARQNPMKDSAYETFKTVGEYLDC